MANGPSVLVNIGGVMASSLRSAVQQTKAQFDSLERSIRVQQRMNEQNRAAMRGQIVDAAALGMTLRSVVNPAIEFETAMADVRKVVDFKDPVNGLNAMSDAIKDMARNIPISQTGLAAIVAAGGRMGIAEDDLRGYAETVAKMSTAWEMAPDAAGESMAKISNIMGLAVKDLEKVGDAINTLDDASAAKAPEILDVLKRTGGMAKLFGLSTQQAAALATTMLDLGRSPEVAGTGINALLNKLQSAPVQSKKFQAALKEVGWSAKGMQQAIKKDAQGTLVKFLEKLQGLEKTKQANILGEMFGAEYSDDLAILLSGMDKYKKYLGIVGDETKYVGSMQREFAIRSQTTANQLQLAGNLSREAAINIGSALLPAIVDVLKFMGPFTVAVSDFAKENPFVIKAVVGTAAALMTLKIAAIGTGYAWTFVKGAGLTTASAMVKTAGMVAATARTLTSASAMIRVAGLVMRGALIATGIGAIMVGAGMAIAWVVENWDNLKITVEAFKLAFDRAIDPIRPALEGVVAPLSTLWTWITNLIGPVEGAEVAFAEFGFAAGAAIGGAVVFVVDLASKIRELIGGAIDAVTARFSAVAAAFDQGVVQGIIAVWQNFNPVALVAQGIGALVAYLSTINLSASGAAIIDTIVQGVKSKAMGLVDAVRDTLASVREYLPFSDAKRGPLSTLTYSGQALIGTIGEGIGKAGQEAISGPLGAAFGAALASMTPMVANASTGLPAAVQPATAALAGASGAGLAAAARPAADALAAASSGGAAAMAGGKAAPGALTVAPTITITVSGNADPAALAQQIRDELERMVADAEAGRRSALHD